MEPTFIKQDLAMDAYVAQVKKQADVLGANGEIDVADWQAVSSAGPSNAT